MAQNKIHFTLAARCEAAGRDNNEDNYQVISDIAADRYDFTANAELTLGDKGTLLVVCDGMGGMNAGEVASAIAVKTVKEAFAAEHITDEALAQPEKFIVQAIQAADAAIKEEGKRNPDTEGMGSTIVLAWLLRGKAYIGWCGDSRAYRYNAVSGLERLSHDHSYVQELVDAGSITEELAFFHPNNNIITRSLGDTRSTVKPDTKVFDIQQGDLYLLCSDGLCGCLQDAQIQSVIEQHHATVAECRDALWQADEAAGWHDNVTTVLAQITKGGIAPKPKPKTNNISHSREILLAQNRRLKRLLIGGGAGIVAVLLVAALLMGKKNKGGEQGTDPQPNDSCAVEQPIDSAELTTKEIESPGDSVPSESTATPPKPEQKKEKSANKPTTGKPDKSKKEPPVDTPVDNLTQRMKDLQSAEELKKQEQEEQAKRAKAEREQIKNGGGLQTASDSTKTKLAQGPDTTKTNN